MEKCIQRAKQTESLEWDSFLGVMASEVNKTKVEKDQLKNDVKEAYGMIFKTEPVQLNEGT